MIIIDSRTLVLICNVIIFAGLMTLGWLHLQTEINIINNFSQMWFKRYLECMWFGALGANIVSLRGVLNHPNLKKICSSCKIGKKPEECLKYFKDNSNQQQSSDLTIYWCNRYFLWHLGRPFMGIVAGLMAAILLSILALRSLVDQSLFGGLCIFPVDSTRLAINYLAAFVLGMEEKRFLDFLFKMADFFLRPLEKKDKQASNVGNSK
jgi:hypothetical protein